MRTTRPDYNSPKPLAYVNKVIREYHRLPIELVRWREGYHTYIYDAHGVYEERSVYTPHTNQQTLGMWVRDAITFAQDVDQQHGITARIFQEIER